MPIGTAGKAMLLLSGGIDSPVAGYMVAKRGVQIEATYFHAPPYTSERAKQKVIDLAKIVSKYSGSITLNVVNFADIQMAIYEKCPHDELTIIMRRYMMKIAEDLGKSSGCQGLVTGEVSDRLQTRQWQVFTVLTKCVQCLYSDRLSVLTSRRLLIYQKRLAHMRHQYSHLRTAVQYSLQSTL